jgi:hypothetical protein
LWTRKMSFLDVVSPVSTEGGAERKQPHNNNNNNNNNNNANAADHQMLDLEKLVHHKRRGLPPVSLDAMVDDYAVPAVVAGTIHSLCDSDPKRRPTAVDIRDSLYHLLHDRFSGDIESLLLSQSSFEQQQQQNPASPPKSAAAGASSSPQHRHYQQQTPSAFAAAASSPPSSPATTSAAAASSPWLDSLAAVPDEVKGILRREMVLSADALALLTEADLREIGVPLGPRKALLQIIAAQRM